MNKVALITGSSRGIGFGIAEDLAQNGFDLVINGVRDENQVTGAIEQLQSYGTNIIYAKGNIGLKEDREAIIQKTKERFGKLNILVNNAGVAPKERKDILEIDESDYDYLMDINLKGPIFLTQLASLWMLEQKNNTPDFEGCIINISSVSAEMVSVQRAEYCISKAGLSMLTQLMAVRLSEVGIPVYEVRPGIIETDMTEVVREKYEKLLSDGLALERRLGKPADIGKVVGTLVKGDIPYATGQVITPDGGLMVRRL